MAKDPVLGVFFPKCRKKHPRRECPLDKVEVCGLCGLEHEIKDSPSLTKAKEVFQSSNVDIEKACLISQKKPWKPQIQGINLDPTPFNSWNNVNDKFPPQYSYPNTQWHQTFKPRVQYQNPWNSWASHPMCG